MENVLTFTFSAEYQMIAMPGSLLQQLSADASAPKGQSKSRAAAGGDDTAESTDVTLTQLAASSGAKLWSNMDGGYVTVCGTAAQVATAKAALLAFVASASERYAELPVQEWMIPSVVGSKGTNITQLQQATGTKLDVDRVKLLVTIQGPSKESIQAAKLALETLIAKLAAQRNVIPASAAGIGAIIGRGGATIRRLQVRFFSLS